MLADTMFRQGLAINPGENQKDRYDVLNNMMHTFWLPLSAVITEDITSDSNSLTYDDQYASMRAYGIMISMELILKTLDQSDLSPY